MPSQGGERPVFGVERLGALSWNVHLRARSEAAAFIYRAAFHLAAGGTAAVMAVATAYLHHPLTGAVAWLAIPILVVAYHIGGHPRLVAYASARTGHHARG